MKRIYLSILSLILIFTMTCVAVGGTDATSVSGDVGAYAGGSREAFAPVGTQTVYWNANLDRMLDLGDQSISDWKNANIPAVVVTPHQVISWVGYGNKINTHGQGGLDPRMPQNWAMDLRFAADGKNLYIAIQISDDSFAPTDSNTLLNGDNVRIGIDLGKKIQSAAEADSNRLNSSQNVVYSLGCTPGRSEVQVKCEGTRHDKWLSEKNGDGIKGSAYPTDGGWICELALSWEMLYDHCTDKLGEDSPIYMGGDADTPLEIGMTVSYYSRSKTAGVVEWAGGTVIPQLNENGLPTVSGSSLENGILLHIPPVKDMDFLSDNIIVLDKQSTLPTTAVRTTGHKTTQPTCTQQKTASRTTFASQGEEELPPSPVSRKDPSFLPALLIAGAILLLAGGGATVYFVIKKKKN